MGLLFRFASFLALVVSVFAATIDSIRSVSESALVLTSLGTAIASIDPSATELVAALERSGGSFSGLAPATAWCLQQPAFAVFLILALLLWMAGYRRPSRHGRFAA